MPRKKKKVLTRRKIKWEDPTIFLLWELKRDSNGLRRNKVLEGLTYARRGAIRWAARQTYRSFEERKVWSFQDIAPDTRLAQSFAAAKHRAAIKKEKEQGIVRPTKEDADAD